METAILAVILFLYCLIFAQGGIFYYALPAYIIMVLLWSAILYVFWYFISFKFEWYVIDYEYVFYFISWFFGLVFAIGLTGIRIANNRENKKFDDETNS